MIIKRNYYIYGCILILSLVTGCRSESLESGVSTEAIGAELNHKLCVWGEVLYGTEYQLNIDFPSVVKTIEVEEGDWVVKGDPLVFLDDSESRNMLAKLESSKSAAESALNNTYQDTSAIEAQIAQAQSNIMDAQRDVNNYQTLHKDGAVSTEALNTYIAVLNRYRTDMKILEAQLAEVKKDNESNRGDKTNELESIIRDLNIYQNKKDKEYLNNSVIICHIDNAIIKNIYVKNESLLGSECSAVMDIINADTIYISAEVNEEFIKDISLGDEVQIIPTMDPDVELSGIISQIAAMAIEKDGNRVVKIRIEFDNPQVLLKPGYTADIYLNRKS